MAVRYEMEKEFFVPLQRCQRCQKLYQNLVMLEYKQLGMCILIFSLGFEENFGPWVFQVPIFLLSLDREYP